jgi:zinc/manganese transport system substrate-binding protein
MRPDSRRRVLLGTACRLGLVTVGVGAVGLGGSVAQAVPAAWQDPAAPRPLQVVASFSILADLAREVGGPAVAVTALAGPNADPHAYQPSPSDLQRVAQADLVLVNGLGFEAWLDRLLANAGPRGAVVVASDGIDVRRVGPIADPHAWQSPAQARRYVDNIEAALLRTLADRPSPPSDAVLAGVRERAAAYRERLAALDRDIRRLLANLPADTRRAITAHSAFGYFGRDYGVTFTSLQGWSPDSEASAGALARVIRQVRAQRAVALFAENTSDSRLLQRVADESGIAIGGTLYADALSLPGGRADTYLRLVAHNARTITDALQRGVASTGATARTAADRSPPPTPPEKTR